MKHAPSGGALRFAISSFRTTCSMMPPPPPPTSFGHEKPTQRFARTFLFHSSDEREVAAVRALGQVLVEERAHLVAERLFLRAEA